MTHDTERIGLPADGEPRPVPESRDTGQPLTSDGPERTAAGRAPRSPEQQRHSGSAEPGISRTGAAGPDVPHHTPATGPDVPQVAGAGRGAPRETTTGSQHSS
ncbi:hypothetical protein ABZ371_26145, partial [Streptomyces sp. NPDC005899]